MLLTDAVIELRYAKDWSKESARWYAGRLKLFTEWAATQGFTTLEEVSPILVRRYLAYLQERPSATGKRLGSHTVHGHVRIIRSLLFWSVGEGLTDETIPRRVKLPRKEEKVLQVLSDDQVSLLFKAAAKTDTPLRDAALLSLVLDTRRRASELCGLKLADVTFSPDVAWILVHGKGRRSG